MVYRKDIHIDPKRLKKWEEKKKNEAKVDLQRLDANCNDCFHLTRDFEARRQAIQNDRDHTAFKIRFQRRKLLKEARKKLNNGDRKKYRSLLKERTRGHKVNIVPNHKGTLFYGYCNKFDKQVSFIPNVFELVNQECFIHRKDKIKKAKDNANYIFVGQ